MEKYKAPGKIKKFFKTLNKYKWILFYLFSGLLYFIVKNFFDSNKTKKTILKKLDDKNKITNDKIKKVNEEFKEIEKREEKEKKNAKKNNDSALNNFIKQLFK